MSKQLIRLQKKLRHLSEDEQLSALIEASNGLVDIDILEGYIRTH